MLGKAQAAAKACAFARFATPPGAREGPPHEGLRAKGPARALQRSAVGPPARPSRCAYAPAPLLANAAGGECFNSLLRPRSRQQPAPIRDHAAPA